MNGPQIKVLFLSANPTNKNIRVDIEAREIEDSLERGDNISFKHKTAVRTRDIRRALLKEAPDIVHFAGHGNRLGSLIVEASNGVGSIAVKPSALGSLFEALKEKKEVQCVLISACFSDEAIDAIFAHVPFVIGMKDEVEDKAALAFAIGFYDGLVDERSIPGAYELGCNSMELEGFDGTIPILKAREGNEEVSEPKPFPLNEDIRRFKNIFQGRYISPSDCTDLSKLLMEIEKSLQKYSFSSMDERRVQSIIRKLKEASDDLKPISLDKSNSSQNRRESLSKGVSDGLEELLEIFS